MGWESAIRHDRSGYRIDEGREDIYERVDKSIKIQGLLSPGRLELLTAEEVKEVLLCTNAISSDHRNKAMIFQKNDLGNIKDGLNVLVNGQGRPAARMSYCNKIKNIGRSTMSEIIGYYYPEQ